MGQDFVRAFNDTFYQVNEIDLSSPDLDGAKHRRSPIQRCLANAWGKRPRPPVYLARTDEQAAALLYGRATSEPRTCKYMVEALGDDRLLGFCMDAGEATARIDSAGKRLIVSLAETMQAVRFSYLSTAVTEVKTTTVADDGETTVLGTVECVREGKGQDEPSPASTAAFGDFSIRQAVGDMVALATTVFAVDPRDRTWATWGPLLRRVHGWSAALTWLPGPHPLLHSTLDRLKAALPDHRATGFPVRPLPRCASQAFPNCV